MIKSIAAVALTIYLVVQTGLALETRFFETCYQYNAEIHCSKPVSPK